VEEKNCTQRSKAWPSKKAINPRRGRVRGRRSKRLNTPFLTHTRGLTEGEKKEKAPDVIRSYRRVTAKDEMSGKLSFDPSDIVGEDGLTDKRRPTYIPHSEENGKGRGNRKKGDRFRAE